MSIAVKSCLLKTGNVVKWIEVVRAPVFGDQAQVRYTHVWKWNPNEWGIRGRMLRARRASKIVYREVRIRGNSPV